MVKARQIHTAIAVSAVAERPSLGLVSAVTGGLLGLLVLILAIARLGAA
jgi:hypothetical protein